MLPAANLTMKERRPPFCFSCREPQQKNWKKKTRFLPRLSSQMRDTIAPLPVWLPIVEAGLFLSLTESSTFYDSNSLWNTSWYNKQKKQQKLFHTPKKLITGTYHIRYSNNFTSSAKSYTRFLSTQQQLDTGVYLNYSTILYFATILLRDHHQHSQISFWSEFFVLIWIECLYFSLFLRFASG